MPPDPPDFDRSACQWIGLRPATTHFAAYAGPTQSQRHIRPLHWYVACRLVVEGGFDPAEIAPRPPFRATLRGGRRLLSHEPGLGGKGERTLFGGLKTKNVDVTVVKNGIGPVLAVSCKGAVGAFRNLTNRMEEAVGDCTNLHIAYPALVCGYLFVMRANRRAGPAPAGVDGDGGGPARTLHDNDMALRPDGEPVEAVVRFHAALKELADRRGLRNDASRYEAVALALVDVRSAEAGAILPGFPPGDSPLRIERFFQTIYRRYDERFVYAAPDLKRVTGRRGWSPDSPALVDWRRTMLDYAPRWTEER